MAPDDPARSPIDAARPSRTTRRRGLVIALIALGLVGAAIVVPRLADLADASPALAALDQPRTVGDLVPTEVATEIAESARLVDETLGYQFWLARDADGALCMVFQRRYWAGTAVTCADETRFAEEGLTVGAALGSIRLAIRPDDVPADGGVAFTLQPSSTEVVWTPVTAADLAELVTISPERRRETTRVWIGDEDPHEEPPGGASDD